MCNTMLVELMETIMGDKDEKFLREEIILDPSLLACYLFPKPYQPL